VCLIFLAGLALGLRVWVVLALFNDEAAPVASEHGRIAENLLAGRGFAIELFGVEGPTSQQAPFYPLLLTGAYQCFGVGSSSAVLAIELLQCLAGAALVLAVVWLAWSLVPTRPMLGWIVGVGAAVYPAHLHAVAHLQVTVWAALLLALLLAVVVSPRYRATRRGAILAGVLSGVLLLVEPILVLVLPICALAFWLGEEARWTRAAAGRVAIMAGVAAVLICPWLVRGWIVHGEPVFIKSTLGYAFWQGNNPASWGTDKVPKPTVAEMPADPDGDMSETNEAPRKIHHEMVHVDSVALGPEDYQQLGRLTEPERSRELGRRAWRFIRENPGQYVRLCLQRLRYFLLFDETDPEANGRTYRTATVVWLVLVFIGLLVSRSQWRVFWPTYAVFLVAMLFHVLVITSARFRIPVEPMSFLWAGWAVLPLVERSLRRPLRIYGPGECPRDPFGPDHALRGPHFDVHRRSKWSRRRAG
jgi:4-amino-4-deoxy-L-arabinose transferase-like glycosyltransferase